MKFQRIYDLRIDHDKTQQEVYDDFFEGLTETPNKDK